ncbi:alpha/beta fold hydrolase [Ilumatobacter nonamiensis]|uniref:alpha/beta fold hydrolase n=1 Tax=Ilumatobacter nonamiensis TaxID=467093 RepID=UPI0003481B9C|nr:alpha/beta fold hydrolase [Ilumatobacter nonamiensis]
MSDRVVLAHGFTQTARSWADIEARLHESTPGVVTQAIDLPGHGRAGDVHTDLWGAADHLVRQGGAGTYVGYSMGGRVSLHAALAHPELVERLVLIGATAGIDDADERAARRASDERLAERVEQIGVEKFIDEWLANPLFAGLDEESAMRSDRLRNSAAGLASSLRTTGTGTQDPLWSRLGEVRCPTLVLVGEHDSKFRSLGERLTSGIDDSRLIVIEDAGHSVHLENPSATAAALATFVR